MIDFLWVSRGGIATLVVDYRIWPLDEQLMRCNIKKWDGDLIKLRFKVRIDRAIRLFNPEATNLPHSAQNYSSSLRATISQSPWCLQVEPILQVHKGGRELLPGHV